MHDPTLSPPQNGLNLRNPAMPTEDTDPTPASGPNSTDPIFPPKLGKAGPRDVSVTAVQGPGVEPSPPKETTTTERLLSGLLESPSPDVKKKDKPRKRETSGERAADYSASPRPVPVGRKEKGEEAVIVSPASSPGGRAGAGRANAALGAALRARADETLDEPGKLGAKGTRDDQTVPLPRKSDRRGVVAFVAALLLVGGVGWLVLGRGADKPAQTTPTKATTPAPTSTIPPVDTALAVPPPTATAATADDNVVTADPVIESQSLKRAKNPPPRPGPATTGATATSTAAPATAALPPPPPTTKSTATGTSAPVDFDELKKGIKH